jgi:hypothetical protein
MQFMDADFYFSTVKNGFHLQLAPERDSSGPRHLWIMLLQFRISSLWFDPCMYVIQTKDSPPLHFCSMTKSMLPSYTSNTYVLRPQSKTVFLMISYKVYSATSLVSFFPCLFISLPTLLHPHYDVPRPPPPLSKLGTAFRPTRLPGISILGTPWITLGSRIRVASSCAGMRDTTLL